MPPIGFEPTISAGKRPQTHALDLAATGSTTTTITTTTTTTTTTIPAPNTTNVIRQIYAVINANTHTQLT